MLTDITLGQYIPTNSPVHKLDSRIKIISVFIYIIAVFLTKGVLSYLLLLLGTFLLIKVSKIRLLTVLKSIRPLLFLIVFTGVMDF